MRRPGEEYGWEAGGASYRLRRVGVGQHLDELTAPVPAPALVSHRGVVGLPGEEVSGEQTGEKES